MNGNDLSVLIFMTGRNCQDYIKRAIASVVEQSHQKATVLYVDDASDDGSYELAARLLNEMLPGRHTLVRNNERMGKAFSASTHLRAVAGEHDVIAILDADDRLIDPNIIRQMMLSYEAGKDVVWTNFMTDRERLGGNGPLSLEISPRAQAWRSSHFFTFRASLLLSVPESYFQYPDGRWLDAACDFAIAYPILDQTRRYEFIPKPAYCYTETNPNSHHNMANMGNDLSSPRQRSCASIVRAKAPLPRLDIPKRARPMMASAASGSKVFETSGAQGWVTAVAAHLAASMPRLLERFDVSELVRLDALMGFAWLQLLRQDSRCNTLLLGYGENSVMLECIAQHVRAPLLVMASGNDVPEVTRGEVNVVRTPWAEYEMSGQVCYLPQLDLLPASSQFGLVLIDASAWGKGRSAVIALAALAPYMDQNNFSVWMSGMSADEIQIAHEEIGESLPMLLVSSPSAGVLHVRS